ncbi:hypothetical protein MSG28_007291 [Choristoneura fumiferana]|uniref:Uncharacterized protein n=1 Tax=Choristoneura fumiferana TaxID=7141 RepID=A0ACC0JWS6_CHOFU|nr:hypothetical protein MSG28_007291 [Choristoneura fumiferana]
MDVCPYFRVSLKADCEECVVEVKQLGINPSGFDGFAMKKGALYKLGHGTRVELLLNFYCHIIEFDPPPEGFEPKTGSKRKLEEEEDCPRKKKNLEADMDQASSSISEAVTNFWEEIDNGELYVFTSKGVKSSSKIAAFDMDGTLIKTKSGRVANWAPGKKKDHSMADKLMAENLGLKFDTPEQFFLGHSVANILVLVGYPGSGKSFIAKQIETKSQHKYVAVCRDVLGSWQKCAAEAKKLLQQGKSVIVDSTNPDVESRGRWTSLAKEMNVECRCAKMMTTKAHAQHNNKFRELMKMNHVPVNDIIFHSYKNKFKDPIPSEGFKEVIAVDFNPCFDDKDAEELYKCIY